jgi:hypothetical protein
LELIGPAGARRRADRVSIASARHPGGRRFSELERRAAAIEKGRGGGVVPNAVSTATVGFTTLPSEGFYLKAGRSSHRDTGDVNPGLIVLHQVLPFKHELAANTHVRKSAHPPETTNLFQHGDRLIRAVGQRYSAP